MRLTTYNNYKKSGLSWIDKIPSTWDTKRTKNIFKEIVQKSQSGDELLLTVSHITGVTPRREKNVNMFFAESMEGYKLCKKGDLIVNTMWAWMGALGISSDEGICSPAYGVYRCLNQKEYFPKYFDYLFRTQNFIVEMTRYSKGITSSRLRLYPSEFFQIISILPPITTQIEVVKLLDKKTSQIDKIVGILEKKKKRYYYLRKKLIDDVLCKGINKNVKLKKTNINYLSEVMPDAQIRRIKDFILKIESGSRDKGGSVEEGIISISAEHINWEGHFNLKNKKYVSLEHFSKMTGGRLRENDIILTKDGATIGKSAFIDKLHFKDMAVNEHMFIIRGNKRVLPKYLYYWLSTRTIYGEICKTIKNTGVPGINSNFINNIFICYLDMIEQGKIVEYLDKKTSKIDNIIGKIGDQISTLTEFRKTLINDVVTGKEKVAE